MTTEQHPPQGTSTENDKPNEYGFAGAATAPQPETDGTADRHATRLHEEAEATAVPAGDITGAVTGAIDELTDRDDR
ncbi:hypothetical protein [Actinoplanes sp. DH11]|uniref:hypothetical protein n=1 Tax=Actinoplanes sp. DH11 TaxID=2857011 RepID=UPI001E3CF9FD|nr:hypothetical protein [Actinoplanes sp. DH11]